jgi:hypothetical protein
VDLDGDHVKELVVVRALTVVQHLRHLPDGGFGLSEPLNVAGNVNGLVAADFDGDGRPDLAVGCIRNRAGILSVLMNIGGGRSAPSRDFPLKSYPINLIAADLDGGRNQDLAVMDGESGALTVLRNDGLGAFAEGSKVAVESKVFTLACADLDGDDRPDLAFSKKETGVIWVLLNGGDASFPGVRTYAAEGESMRILAADLDGDGMADLVTANGSNRSVSVLYNREGTFETEPGPPERVGTGIEVGNDPAPESERKP